MTTIKVDEGSPVTCEGVDSNANAVASYSSCRKGKGLSFKRATDMAAYIVNHGVELIDACFCDPFGQWHHMTFTPNQCELKDLENGWAFDGSSIRLFKSIEESDMLMVPDPTTCFIDPFPKHHVMHVTCNVHEADGSEFERCPRTTLQRTNKFITQELGLCTDIVVGPELEFFLFNDVKYDVSFNGSSCYVDAGEGPWNTNKEISGGNLAHRPMRKQFYAPTFPVDTANDLRADMLLCLDDLGVPAEKHHHEVAAAQHELGITCSTAVETADNCMIFKYVVKNIAANNGQTACFMPKPIAGTNGSGMHTHMSLWNDEKNLFYDENGSYCQLSETAMYFIGGVLKHAHAILAFCCPSVNSYKRLVPGFEAPNLLCFSAGNRSACIRIPIVGKNEWRAKRIEFRCPDCAACPYLAISSIALAGIDGIRNKIQPPKPLDKDLYDESATMGIENTVLSSAPENLKQALDALQDDHAFLTAGGCFTEGFINAYIQYNTLEYYSIVNIPTPKEFEHYYHC